MEQSTLLKGFTAELACGIARRAGAIMKEVFTSHNVARDIKSDDTPVTLADTRINRMVIEIVRLRFPHLSIRGEEESDLKEGEWELLVDPIDGTFPFTWGMPIATFMLALLYRGKPVLSVIFDPFMDRMYVAEAGKGATMNGKPIRVSDVGPAGKKPVVAIVTWPSCPYPMLPIAYALEKRGYLTVSLCPVGYVVAAVATGEFVASIFPGGNAHDSAAGELLVSEAGGRATSIRGEDQTYVGKVDGHLITNGHVHEDILQTVLEEVGMSI